MIMDFWGTSAGELLSAGNLDQIEQISNDIVRNYCQKLLSAQCTPQAVVHEQPGVHAMRVGFDNSYFGKEEKFNVIKRIALSYHSLVLQVDQL